MRQRWRLRRRGKGAAPPSAFPAEGRGCPETAAAVSGSSRWCKERTGGGKRIGGGGGSREGLVLGGFNVLVGKSVYPL